MSFNPTIEPDGSLSLSTIAEIEKQLYINLEEYSIEKSPAEHRNHLGVSVIGDKCWRKLWYIFRWAKVEEFDPRMRRLFLRGHFEEPRFVDILMWMGFHIRDINPETNKQYRFNAVNGHYGGSGDSIALLPWFRNESFRILVEFKTHNKKSFDKLKAEKVKISKPQHWTQMCGYGREFKTKYGLYCAVNKDNDDYHFELLQLDWNLATEMEKKATDIITAKLPPARISDNPAWFDCRYCHFSDICHNNAPVEKNCRSCRNAVPIDNGEWKCLQFNDVIPKDFIKKGCDSHVSINS